MSDVKKPSYTKNSYRETTFSATLVVSNIENTYYIHYADNTARKILNLGDKQKIESTDLPEEIIDFLIGNQQNSIFCSSSITDYMFKAVRCNSTVTFFIFKASAEENFCPISYFNFFLDSLPLAVAHFDSEDILVYGNSKYYEFFSDERNGRVLLENISKKTDFNSKEISFEGWEKKGTRFFHVTVIPEKIRRGYICIYSDYTEIRKIRDYQEKLNIKLNETQRLESLGVLAGGIAHDFNNMLMGILGNIGLALIELPASSSGLEYLHNIETSALRLAELTKQLMAYSGKTRFLISSININSLVKEMTNLLDTGRPPDVTVNYDLCPALPNISGDASQIRQVLMNIIINAFESIKTPPGIISISTGISEYSEDFLMDTQGFAEITSGEYVFIKVRDTGEGMAKDTIEKIFDPFFTTKNSGRGLGLGSALGIVRSHKGVFKVESELGKGSTFTLLFPPSQEPENIRPQIDDISTYAGDGIILIIDDEEWVRIVVKNTLRKFGYTVLTASDGMEGIRIFATNQEKIRLVLLDMMMPGLSGRETFNELSLLEPEIPVLLTSGYSEEEAFKRFGKNSIAGFIQKPFTPINLVRAIKNILG
ncbi:response regulator [Myxococcota bacterium]|nr:response regulator [Myxococcota bacterium]MBU1495291.1 response regulator [Myxococcota bacterium]